MKRLNYIPIAIAVILAAAAPVVLAAWDGQQTIRPGDSVSAEFVGEPGAEAHEVRFYAPAGTVVRTTVSVNKGSALLPMVKLLDDHGGLLRDLGVRDRFEVETSGWHRLEVTSTTGTGRYTLKTRGRIPARIKETTDAGMLTFDAVAGTLLTAQVKKAKGSAAVPVITGLTGPDGAVDLGAEGHKVKRILLAESGSYSLAWRDDGEGGDVTAKVTLKSPRSKNSYSFGPIETAKDVVVTPNEDRWAGSAHGDASAAAFRYFDGAGEIRASCAKCHSTGGFHDFLGEDGSAPGVVDAAAELGTTIQCDACHNDSAQALDSVTFPSGRTATGLGSEAICMQCHQGRESGISLEAHIVGAELADADTVSAELSFKNIHYFAAGATLYGGAVNGAYQYEGKNYDERNPHVASHDTCTECHDAHTLEVKLDSCSACHSDLESVEDLKDVRMAGSFRDYDGDGDTDEGLYGEIATLKDTLYAAMLTYADKVADAKLGYNSGSYPYFFTDLDGSGEIEESEANYGNGYKSWTPRLLRAAYNYQFAKKDPGAYAHNPKYVIEFLHDSIEDLASHELVDVPGLATMNRNDSGHFDAGAKAFRYWDSEQVEGSIERGTVSTSCARCHTPGGFDFFAEWGTDITKPAKVGDGMRCETCHTGSDLDGDAPRKFIAQVEFPSEVVVKNDAENADDSLLCMSCHQGRESKKTVDDRIASGKLGPYAFRNVHYLPAGAMLFGADATVGYEYEGRTYAGRWTHFQSEAGTASQCSYCHLDDHSFEPKLTASCQGCHAEAGSDLARVRLNRGTDYNGNGDATETLKDEVKTFGERLFAAIQAYAAADEGLDAIGYGTHYPYFFKDANGNGTIDAEEGSAYGTWDAALMKATFNYQFWKKEPGAWAHNTDYVLQLLYDSIEDLGGDVTGLTRP